MINDNIELEQGRNKRIKSDRVIISLLNISIITLGFLFLLFILNIISKI